MPCARLRPLLLALPLLGLAACQDDATKIQQHLARGDQYMEEGKVAEAEIEFKSALQIDPNDAKAHYKLAHANLRNRKLRDGFWELRETIRLDPKQHDAQLEFAQLAILAGQHEEALEQADLVLKDDAKNVPAYVLKGQALDALKRPDDALAVYRAAVQVAPEDTAALRALALALGQRAQLQEAEQLWQQIVALDKNFAAHTGYAFYLLSSYRKERSADAEAELRKALEVANDKEKVAAYVQLANFYQSVDRADDAATLLQQGIDGVAENVDLLYALARLEFARGHADAADALIERTTKEKPDDPRVFLVLANYRAQKGQRAAALEATDRAVALQPDNNLAKLRKAEILVEMGWRKERDGGVEEGAKIVSDVLSREPTNANALFVDAKVKITRKENAEAIKSLRAALEARPDWAEARYVLGTALAAQKEYPAARGELARALELDPNLVEANQVLAQVHQQLGEHEYAVEVGRRYLVTHPDDATMNLLVAQSLVRLGKLDDADSALGKLAADKRGPEVDYALGRIALARAEGDWAAGHDTKLPAAERARLRERARDERVRARERLLAAVAKLPNHPDVLESLFELERSDKAAATEASDAAAVAAASQRLDDAAERIQKASAANPKDAKLQQLVGVVEVTRDHIPEGEAAFRKAIELDPSDAAGYERLARLLSATGQTQKTVEVYELAIKARPENAGFHHYLGMLYELGGDRQRAIERYESAIQLQPNLAEAKNNLAYLYADKGENLDRALDLAQDAKALLPDNPSVADTLGWVLYKRGVPAAAITYLKEAEAKTAPNDASIGVVRHHLAQAYAAAGQTDEAIKALDRSLESYSDQADAIRKQGREPGPEPAWVGEARTLREQQLAKQSAG